ncbi:MAG: hypothetical protein KA480_06420 [Anaerolineales bacterium]|nr:hypothetical protein [Anaerolineales bacterium]
MDKTIQRIIEEVAREKGIDVGFLLRVVQLEETKAHLTRRHGLFDEIREISRKYAQREIDSKKGLEKNED